LVGRGARFGDQDLVCAYIIWRGVGYRGSDFGGAVRLSNDPPVLRSVSRRMWKGLGRTDLTQRSVFKLPTKNRETSLNNSSLGAKKKIRN